MGISPAGHIDGESRDLVFCIPICSSRQVLNAMRPWKHESEIADYVESQRSMSTARTPSTPSFPQPQPRPEDLTRLDQATSALRDLRSRLSSNDELSNIISALLVFLQDLRRDFPLQAPEGAFERLQELRSWLFWLPLRLFKPDESDIGALAVLAHFFGVALALDPLFPEIGSSFLGAMSVTPIEEINRILLARRAAHPQDVAVATALNLVEVPIRTVSSHKAKQQFLVQRSQSMQASPHSPYLGTNIPTMSSPASMPLSIFTNSPVPSPATAIQQGSPYLQPNLPADARRSSGYFDEHPQGPPPSNDYPYNYTGPTLTSNTGYPSPQVKSERRTSSMGYESPFFQGYGIDTGFVSPTELWT